MKMFIKGLATITGQSTFDTGEIPESVSEFNGDLVQITEPSYEGLIDPRVIRRMSKIIRISVAAALKCLSEARVSMPNGILTGTSYGCMEDTESFLQKMVTQNEEALNPTPFIQSTHNTVSGQIALLLKCYGYNSTYTQKGFSFENCLMDAQLLLEENPDQNLLVGGVDEVIELSHDILKRFHFYRQNSVSNLNLLKSESAGTMDGEGCSYFVLSGSEENALAGIKGFRTFYKPRNSEKVKENILGFLSENKIEATDIDFLLTGRSGDSRFDNYYNEAENLFPASSIGNFKHLSGDYPTASAFGLWLAAKIISKKSIPAFLLRKEARRKAPANVLIYNHYFGVHHSLILVQGDLSKD